jgi:type I restriction enzyme, S subunit
MNGEWIKMGIGEFSVNELPCTWTWTTTSEVCESVRDGTHDTPKYVEAGVPLVTSKNLRNGSIDFSTTKNISNEDHEEISKRSAVKNGDILFAMIGTLGNPIIVDSDKPFSIKNIGLFKKNELVISSAYLRFWLDSFVFWEIIKNEDFIKGSTQKFISLNHLRKIPLPLPPLNEQRRIVAKLDSLFARSRRAREELERVAGLCDRYRRSVLAAACSGQLTADWREQNPYIESASELLKQIQQENLGRKRPIKVSEGISNPFELPEGWKWARLFDICRSITDGDHLPPPQSEAGVPFLTISNITTGKINFDKTRYVPESYYQKIDQTRKPYKGDILYTAVGATYGTPVLVDTKERFCFQRHIAILKPSLLLDAQCLLYILKSDLVYSQATNVVTGTAQPTVPLSGLRVIKVPLPPLIEQKEIVLRVEKLFNAIAQLEAEYQKALKLCDRLDQAILTQAFSGNLVPQDPTDEPADVLLDRIRAEKQDLPKSKKLRSKHKPATRSLPLNSAEDRL